MRLSIIRGIIIIFSIINLCVFSGCSKMIYRDEYDYPNETVYEDNIANTVIIGGSSACAYEEDEYHLFKKSGWSEFYCNYETNSNIINLSIQGKSLADFLGTNWILNLQNNLKENDKILLQIEIEDYQDSALIEEISEIINIFKSKSVDLYIILPFYTYSDESIKEKKEALIQLANSNNVSLINLDIYSWFSTTEKDKRFSDLKTNRMEHGLSCYKDKNDGFDYEGYNEIFADIVACTIYLYSDNASEMEDVGIMDLFGKLEPNLSYDITRGEFVDNLIKLCNFTVDLDIDDNFVDVDTDSIFYSSLATAKTLGLINGNPDGTFHPNEKITLSDACVISLNFLRAADSKYNESYFYKYLLPLSETTEEWYKKEGASLFGVEEYAVVAVYDLSWYGILVFGDTFEIPMNYSIIDIYRFFYDNIYI